METCWNNQTRSNPLAIFSWSNLLYILNPCFGGFGVFIVHFQNNRIRCPCSWFTKNFSKLFNQLLARLSSSALNSFPDNKLIFNIFDRSRNSHMNIHHIKKIYKENSRHVFCQIVMNKSIFGNSVQWSNISKSSCESSKSDRDIQFPYRDVILGNLALFAC